MGPGVLLRLAKRQWARTEAAWLRAGQPVLEAHLDRAGPGGRVDPQDPSRPAASV